MKRGSIDSSHQGLSPEQLDGKVHLNNAPLMGHQSPVGPNQSLTAPHVTGHGQLHFQGMHAHAALYPASDRCLRDLRPGAAGDAGRASPGTL